MTTRAYFMAGLAGLVLVGTAAAADWPQWRGPGRSGVAPAGPALVATLPEAPTLVWNLPAGPGKPDTHASPACADGRVYLKTATEERVEEGGKTKKVTHAALVCASLADGKELWRKTFESDCHQTPCVAGGKLYVVVPGRKASLHCLDAAGGKELWSCPLGDGVNESSPVLAGDVVAVVTNRNLVGVDAAKGTVRWSVPVKAWNNSPAVWVHDGTPYVVAGNREIVCVRASDGTEAWRAAGTSLEKDPGSPVVVGDRMAVAWEGLGVVVFRLSPTGAEKVASCDAFVPQTGGAHQAMTPCFDGRFVYVVDKEKTFCFDADAGKVVWTGPKADTHSSPVLADGKLLVSGKRSLVMLDAKTGEPLGQTKAVDMAGCSSPAVVGDRLIVNAGAHLRCYNLGAQVEHGAAR